MSSAAAAAAAAATSDGSPSVTSDPRFHAGRNLVSTGRAGDGAIGMFATLVEESRRKYGEASVESAACYYEYGNALFRATFGRRQEDEEKMGAEEDDDRKLSAAVAASGTSSSASSAVRTAAAEAAERRAMELASVPVSSSSPLAAAAESVEPMKGNRRDGERRDEGTVVEEDGGCNENAEEEKEQSDNDDSDDDDVRLALELMENAWSILDEYVSTSSSDPSSSSSKSLAPPYLNWAKSQLPRTLTGIGDVLSSLGRHADSVDAYTRALVHRERAAEDLVEKSKSGKGAALTGGGLELLAARRHMVEANVLIAEELLACPPNQDIVTTETGDVLVKSAERVEYSRGYYDKARDGLQEAVFLMGKLTGEGVALGTEKEDVCHLATMLMGVGTTLAELDEEEEARGRSPKKRKM